jgi:hypothetical protein
MQKIICLIWSKDHIQFFSTFDKYTSDWKVKKLDSKLVELASIEGDVTVVSSMTTARFSVRSIAPSGWRCSNEVLRYCTVRLTELEWGFALLHRQAARGALTAVGLGTLPLSDGWSEATPFLTAGATLPLSDGWVYLLSRPLGALWRLTVGPLYTVYSWRLPSPFLTAGCTNRQAARGAVTAYCYHHAPFIMCNFKYFHIPCFACCI